MSQSSPAHPVGCMSFRKPSAVTDSDSQPRQFWLQSLPLGSLSALVKPSALLARKSAQNLKPIEPKGALRLSACSANKPKGRLNSPIAPYQIPSLLMVNV